MPILKTLSLSQRTLQVCFTICLLMSAVFLYLVLDLEGTPFVLPAGVLEAFFLLGTMALIPRIVGPRMPDKWSYALSALTSFPAVLVLVTMLGHLLLDKQQYSSPKRLFSV
jgi:hypothetical protein